MNQNFIPPKTIDEVSIHLGNLFDIQKRIEDKIDGIGNRFCTQTDFIELKKNVDDHTNKIDSLLGDRKWLFGFMAAVIILQGVIWYAANTYITSQVDESVKKVLSDYNITYETTTQR